MCSSRLWQWNDWSKVTQSFWRHALLWCHPSSASIHTNQQSHINHHWDFSLRLNSHGETVTDKQYTLIKLTTFISKTVGISATAVVLLLSLGQFLFASRHCHSRQIVMDVAYLVRPLISVPRKAAADAKQWTIWLTNKACYPMNLYSLLTSPRLLYRQLMN